MARTTLARTTSKAVAVRKPPAKSTPGKSAMKVSAGERLAMIQVAAYFKAVQSGFNGDCMAHWLAAEKDIDRKLNGS